MCRKSIKWPAEVVEFCRLSAVTPSWRLSCALFVQAHSRIPQLLDQNLSATKATYSGADRRHCFPNINAILESFIIRSLKRCSRNASLSSSLIATTLKLPPSARMQLRDFVRRNFHRACSRELPSAQNLRAVTYASANRSARLAFFRSSKFFAAVMNPQLTIKYRKRATEKSPIDQSCMLFQKSSPARRLIELCPSMLKRQSRYPEISRDRFRSHARFSVRRIEFSFAQLMF